MAATGNEVARLEQLKGVFSQVITLVNSPYVRVTLGNGRQVSFGSSPSSTVAETRILARVMYNSIEIMQAVTDYSGNVIVEVTCDTPMNLLVSKLTGNSGTIRTMGRSGNVDYVQVNAATKRFTFTIEDNQLYLIGATIYVD